MTSLLLTLALLAPPGVHYQGSVGTGAVTPSGLTLVSTATTSDTSTSSVTTTVPVTASAGQLVVVIQACGSDGGLCGTVSGVSGATLGAFTVIGSDASWDRVTAYYVVAGSSVTADTVTVTQSAAGTSARITAAYVFSGQHASPIGAAAGASPPTPAAVSVTPQAVGSYILWGAGQDGAATTPTANAVSTVDLSVVNGTLQAAWVGRSTDKTTSTSAISVGTTNTGLSTSMYALEVKAGS